MGARWTSRVKGGALSFFSLHTSDFPLSPSRARDDHFARIHGYGNGPTEVFSGIFGQGSHAACPENLLDRQEIPFSDIEGLIVVHDRRPSDQLDDHPFGSGMGAVSNHGFEQGGNGRVGEIPDPFPAHFWIDARVRKRDVGHARASGFGIQKNDRDAGSERICFDRGPGSACHAEVSDSEHDVLHGRLGARSSRRAGPISSMGTSRSVPPSSYATLGIPKTTELFWSWARVFAPARRMASKPLPPSPPIPVRMAPTAFAPTCLAT